MVILNDNNLSNIKTLSQMVKMPHYLNRYFWLANVFFWLAIHGLFVHLHYGNARELGGDLSWAHTWVLLSPWFLSWIWVTAGIVIAIHSNDQSDVTRTRRIVSHVIWMIALLICYWAFCSGARILFKGDSLTGYWDVFTNVLYDTAQLDALIYLGILAVGLNLRFYHNSINEGVELKRLQHELTQEQLKTLRSQLNPHFLFNALNTIASLVRLKREKDAVSALSELSLMLRKVLDNINHSEVTIQDEIGFINSYLAIQKMRFLDKLKIHICVQPDCLDLKIPTMILQPLVENAVSHGSQFETNHNPFNLEISRSKNELKVVMTNKVAKSDIHTGYGIGLTNTRERLSKIYTHFRLESNMLHNDLFETMLAIPIGDLDT